MRRYYTAGRIKDVLRQAEALGINTIVARADHHIMRLLLEYWDEGGKLQWFSQTCPEIGSMERGVDNAIRGGARACHIHGGVMDSLFYNNKLDEVPPAIEKIKRAGLAAGIAGHDVKVFQWAEKNLDLDFYMCSYYNPIVRTAKAEHVAGTEEVFDPKDRDAMVGQIRKLTKPVIHYKVMAGGRNNPEEALSFVARNLRPQDAVCVGVYPKEKPDMLAEDVGILERFLQTGSGG